MSGGKNLLKCTTHSVKSKVIAHMLLGFLKSLY